jgi:FkbM family methyltransferase
VSKPARALSRLIFGREGLSRRLEKSAFVQSVAHRLRARERINTALARHPIRRLLPQSGVKYQIENFETLAVERAYFGNPVYSAILTSFLPATFIDLGCNAGIFPCLLAHLAHGRPPRGLCVDANLAQIQLAQKTVRLNGWSEVEPRHGLVGSKEPAAQAEFFLHPTSLGSSQFAYQDSESGRPPDWKRVMVPTLNVADTWTQLFGPALRCDCLKIDIEGSEMNVLRQEASFLSRVESILLEWHIWATTRREIEDFLAGHGFRLVRVVEETPRHGVLFLRRSD